MQLSIVIPAYNEAARLPGTLALIDEYFREEHAFTLHEVIVVDDGSIDGTGMLAVRLQDRIPVRCIRLPKNRGKGAAVRAGVLDATGDCVLIYDADSATPIEEVEALIVVQRERGVDIVIGSRELGQRKRIVRMSLHRRIVGRIYHRLASLLTPGIADVACGCKLFRRDVARRIFSLQKLERYAFDVEILSLALSLGYTIVEVPVHWKAVPDSKVRLVRDGLEMFWRLAGLYLNAFLFSRLRRR